MTTQSTPRVGPRVKWHMLRRRKSEAAFLRENLTVALRSGAACEVDLAFTADGHALCIHDRTLDRETNGHGRVSEATRSAIEALRQRAPDGAVLDSAPLFLDEVVARVRSENVSTPALVQLDVKARADTLTQTALRRFGSLLEGQADAFIASAYEWDVVQRLADSAPGLHRGFDPLAFYPRSFSIDASGFRDIAARMFATAPGASIYYLEARLILEAFQRGVDLIEPVRTAGARVDAWTIDVDYPGLNDSLRRLIELGCHQITSNDPEQLRKIIDTIVASV